MPLRGLPRLRPIEPTAELSALSYENRLRVVGRRIDMDKLKQVVVMEVDGGILVRGTKDAYLGQTLLEFPDDAFPQLIREAINFRGRGSHNARESALVPTGYQDLLRALGSDLDSRYAKAVTIVEAPDYLHVTGFELESSLMRSGIAPFAMRLGPADTEELIDRAERSRK